MDVEVSHNIYLFLDTGGGTQFAVVAAAAAAITIVAVAVVKKLVGDPVMERYCRRLSRRKTQ